MADENITDVSVMRDAMEELFGAKIATVHDPNSDVSAPFLLRPAGRNGVGAESLKKFIDEFRTEPLRRAGTATFTKLASFIEHVQRFNTIDQVALFADVSSASPSITSVLDYHEPSSGTGSIRGWLGHRGVYRPAASEQWKTWIIGAQGPDDYMDQGDFAEFIENNILDIIPPPEFNPNSKADQRDMAAVALLGGSIGSPDQLMQFSRGLSISESSALTTSLNIATGETLVAFASEHRDKEGQKLKLPSIFFIGIPVFEGEQPYRIMVRLRYRKAGGSVGWNYIPYKASDVFMDAFTSACETAHSETMTPLFYGKPEGSS